MVWVHSTHTTKQIGLLPRRLCCLQPEPRSPVRPPAAETDCSNQSSPQDSQTHRWWPSGLAARAAAGRGGPRAAAPAAATATAGRGARADCARAPARTTRASATSRPRLPRLPHAHTDRQGWELVGQTDERRTAHRTADCSTHVPGIRTRLDRTRTDGGRRRGTTRHLF